MSYDIQLGGIEFDTPHLLTGGTYAAGGTTEPWLNVTYNYSEHFNQVLGSQGIRAIYGMTASDSIPILQAAAKQLKGEVSTDYWEPTEGNARQALLNLVAIAEQAVREGKGDAKWEGD